MLPSTRSIFPSHFVELLPPQHAHTILRKRAVSSQTSELEALEARLKATEERLKAAAANASGVRSGRSSPRQRMPVGDAFSPPKEPQTSPLATEFRTKTHNGGERKGSLPPTPGASEGELDLQNIVQHI